MAPQAQPKQTRQRASPKYRHNSSFQGWFCRAACAPPRPPTPRGLRQLPAAAGPPKPVPGPARGTDLRLSSDCKGGSFVQRLWPAAAPATCSWRLRSCIQRDGRPRGNFGRTVSRPWGQTRAGCPARAWMAAGGHAPPNASQHPPLGGQRRALRPAPRGRRAETAEACGVGVPNGLWEDVEVHSSENCCGGAPESGLVSGARQLLRHRHRRTFSAKDYAAVPPARWAGSAPLGRPPGCPLRPCSGAPTPASKPSKPACVAAHPGCAIQRRDLLSPQASAHARWLRHGPCRWATGPWQGFWEHAGAGQGLGTADRVARRRGQDGIRCAWGTCSAAACCRPDRSPQLALAAHHDDSQAVHMNGRLTTAGFTPRADSQTAAGTRDTRGAARVPPCCRAQQMPAFAFGKAHPTATV